MIVLILAIILVGLSVLERIVYIKKGKNWDKVRLFIGLLILCIITSITYFSTDTWIGMLYVFMFIIIFILIGFIINRSKIELLKHLSYIIGFPLMAYLLIKASQNILINMQYLFLLLTIINLILSYPYKGKGTKKENISFAIGVVIIIIMALSNYKLSEFEERIMVKQEIVAQKYLEEELGLYGFEVYAYRYNGSIRGEKVRISAYDSSGTYIEMVYKDNKIIRHNIKDD